MMNEESPVVLYTSPDGKVMVNAIVQNETLWLTQAAMAQLFGVAPQNITYHLKNIFRSGELSELATCKEILQVQEEGERRVERLLKHYSLDAIIAVGYRVDSMRATQFRIWATNVLKEVLEGPGRVSRQAADAKAGLEYDQFNRTQKIVSDFDREVKRLLDGERPDGRDDAGRKGK